MQNAECRTWSRALVGSTGASVRLLLLALMAAAASGCDRGPEVTVKIVDYDGIQKVIEGHRGKVVVMDAWSTGCPPCVRDFPRLVALHKKHDRKDLACISLSFEYEGVAGTSPEDARKKILPFLREKGATFDNLLSSEESDTLYRKFKLTTVPAVFVYDRQGKLRKRFDNDNVKKTKGEFSYDQVEALVAELIKEPG